MNWILCAFVCTHLLCVCCALCCIILYIQFCIIVYITSAENGETLLALRRCAFRFGSGTGTCTSAWSVFPFSFFIFYPLTHTRNSSSIISISLMNLRTMLSCLVSICLTRQSLVFRCSMLLISSMPISVERNVGMHLSISSRASCSIFCNRLSNSFNDASQFSKFPGRKMS